MTPAKCAAMALVLAVFLSGCAAGRPFVRRALNEPALVKPGEVLGRSSIDPALEEKILALNPERISEAEVRDILSKAPAPRVVNIHGGIYPVYLLMVSFSEFLISMGYPEAAIRDPKDGAYSYSCYSDSKMLAGVLAWHYERDALRPMMVGHSQGGMQAVKVLHELAGHLSKEIPVWNPATHQAEKRTRIVDPFTGQERPVAGLEAVSYAAAIGSGGFTRILPNQWDINTRLRSIPDSVAEFTGFYMSLDILGGDYFGFGGANAYKAEGKAGVRNVNLPFGEHVTVPNTADLARDPAKRKWIGEYHPVTNPKPKANIGVSTNIVLAAEIWYSVKKNWCLELQHLIREKRKGVWANPVTV